MKLLLLILTFLTFGCSHQEISRAPASIDTEFYFGEVSAAKSRVLFFPSADETYFYMEVRDAKNSYVDIESQDVAVLGPQKRQLPHELIRQLRGRYYLALNNSQDIPMGVLKFSIQGKLLKENFKRPMTSPSAETSKVFLIRKSSGVSKMRLVLKDNQGKPVEIPTLPEIISSSADLEIAKLVHVKEGIWEFEFRYSELNIVSYISVRAHGIYMENLHRFQHVEK